jgi:hypothetical protein
MGYGTITSDTAVHERTDSTTSSGIDAMVATSAEIASLRGVTDAAADVSECVCPEPCERDHANE